MADTWEFVTDDEWGDPVSEQLDAMLKDMRQMCAGTLTLTFKGDDDKLLGLRSLARLDGLEVAIEVDCRTGDVIWASRPAPPTCRTCGVEVAPDVLLCRGCSEDDAETEGGRLIAEALGETEPAP